MVAPRPLHELFEVNERFRRSVNVGADSRRETALRGYVVTPLVRNVLARIGAGLKEDAANRAWSITGPYGAGKSACAVFLCQTLGYPPNEAARERLRQDDPALYDQLLRDVPGLAGGGYVMVPVVGSRQPLAWTLVDGLRDAVAGMGQEYEADRRWLAELGEAARSMNGVTPLEVAEAVERTARRLWEGVPGVLGLVIVYDELGKSLEYAALNGSEADVGLLQILAEKVSRAQEPPMALVTILHQAFEHYAAFLSPVQRREWEKVQGRFEDIAFLQSNGELLSLIDRAVHRRADDEGLRRAVQEEVQRAEELTLLPRDLARENAQEALAGCAPLHPTVALVLGKLFRSRLAQNERSLFAFLSSGEPHGFQEYLQTETWGPNGTRPFYRLDRLYDYVQAALGSGLYVHSQGKRWAEIEEALERLPAGIDALDVRLVKIIGMLGLLGDQRHLKASEEILEYALADGRTRARDVRSALGRLEEQHVTVFRRFKDAYSLWQGSDIDLDDCYERGRAQVEDLDLAETLGRHGQLKPYVAKRHLHRTGTFRYFVPWVVNLEDLETVSERPLGNADGAIVFVLPHAGTSLEEARDVVLSHSRRAKRRERTFYAIPHNVQGIREGLDDLAAWQWISDHITELEGDSVARRELKARQLAARERLERAVSRCFDLSSSFRSSLWVRNGELLHFSSPRQLAAALSDVCDQVFHTAPIVKNELINRRSLSSAAAAARRTLIEQMISHGTEQRLGLEGYPPEASMYLAILHASGLHHETTGTAWAFGPGGVEDSLNTRPLWDTIESFLDETEGGQRPITALYDTLSAPPFGIKDGLLPIYLVVAMLHWGADLALYEEGSFVPNPGIAEFERLLRAPERFALQRYRMSDARLRLLTGYARLFRPDVEPAHVSLLSSVRALMGFAGQLPQYTRLTDHLTSEAQATRRALYSAQEPQTLLFRLLPEALGCAVLDGNGAVDDFLQRLRSALLELQSAYGSILEEVESDLLSALRLPSDVAAARVEIRQRAGIVQDYVADTRLRAFLFRLGDDQLPDREWIESVAAMVANKPPQGWNDADARSFRVALSSLCAQLRRVEEVALSRKDAPAEERVLRLGITGEDGKERRDLLRVRPEQERAVHHAIQAVEQALGDLGLDPEIELTALALLAQRMLERRTSSGEGRHE